MNSENKMILDLAQKILHHRQLYYAGKPEISDAEFDALEEKLRQISPNHPVLQFVGSDKPSAVNKKVEHRVPMLSLQKTYDLDDLTSWAKGHRITGTYKIDGNSLSLIYKKGLLTQAKTRGNGYIGEEVTEKAVWVPDIPHNLLQAPDLEIRGELFCTESRFLGLIEEMGRLGLEKPTSARNIVAGLLGRKGYFQLAGFFNFFAFDIIQDQPGKNAAIFSTEEDKFEFLKKLGFKLPNPKLLSDKEEIISYLEDVREEMEAGEIGLDGAVFSYNDLSLHQELGATSHHPRYKMSFKWAGQTATAKILKINWETSRLGINTPVAVIEPTELSGATITNVTLHNAEHVRALNLKIGDEIEIIRSGEVIPKFLSVKNAAPGNFLWPKECSSCKTPLEFDGVRLRCPNTGGCPAQQTRDILNWIKSAEINDLSEKRLNNLIDLGLVKQKADLYLLTVDNLLRLPLTKEKMAQKLFDNIQASKTMSLSRFLAGLGIEGAGPNTWEKLLLVFPSLDSLSSATKEEISRVDGFAERSAGQIVDGLRQKKQEISQLLAHGIKPVFSPSAQENSNKPLNGMQFVITGALSKPRDEIEAVIKAAGGKVSSAVSKNTSAVITNDTEAASSKAKKARELGVEFWNEDKLWQKLKTT